MGREADDRAEVRVGDGNPVTRRKAMARPYAVAAQQLETAMPSVHAPIYGYVRALQNECAYHRVLVRQLRAELEEVRARG
jgi:hypothetical protein